MQSRTAGVHSSVIDKREIEQCLGLKTAKIDQKTAKIDQALAL